MASILTDTLQSSTLTAAAAWVVATYSLTFGTSNAERVGIAVFMAAYFTGIQLVAASGLIAHALVFGLPVIGLFVAIPLASVSTYLLFTPGGLRRVRGASLPAIISVHFLRVLGAWFIVAYHADRLPAPFAPFAGWGDILAGVLAIPATLAARQKPRGDATIWAFNTIGALDLIGAVSFGLTSIPSPYQVFKGKPDTTLMTLEPWLYIPGFLVPSLLALHAVTFYRLINDGTGNTARSGRRKEL